jgi:pimeloyl-ACP methyl ester carboxylesterase
VPCGEKDVLFRPEYMKALASRIPNVELVVWDDLAHGFFQQKPEETLKVALDFLRRHPKK